MLKRIYREETGNILNHITLQISDAEAVKDLEKHKMKQQNSIYYVIQITALAHIMISTYSFFI
jgi:hypothetical protein